MSTTTYEHSSAMAFARMLAELPMDCQMEARRTMEAKQEELSEETTPTMYLWSCEFLAAMAYLMTQEPSAMEDPERCAMACKMADGWAMRYSASPDSDRAMEALARMERKLGSSLPVAMLAGTGAAKAAACVLVALAMVFLTSFGWTIWVR